MVERRCQSADEVTRWVVEAVLDYIRYFILFEQDDASVIKKIAGYHQFHAVREAVRVTLIASAPAATAEISDQRATWGHNVQPGSRKAGVVWHTQGSGKSITMCCYAGKLLQQPEMNNPTIVVVTDRNDLDGQLFATFSNAQELLRQTPQQAESRDELRELLRELLGAEPRLKQVEEDLVRHFEERISVSAGKGMTVCMSREICAQLYKELTTLRPAWHDPDPGKGVLKIVMTGSAADTALLQPHIYNKATKKRLEKRFKDPKDDLKDMWLTGFDAPSCHTMYIDKPMRGLFHGFDYSDYLTNAHRILILAANHLLGLKDGKKRFLDVMASITKAFSLCGTLDAAALSAQMEVPAG